MVTKEDIASDLFDYLKDNPNVCANGNVHGWTWIRFHDGEWQATKYYTGDDRLKSFVVGRVLEERKVLDYLAMKPITLIPQSEAYLWGPSDQTVWEDADEQDVFRDFTRCYWCGCSERTHDLQEYDTVDDGDTVLCSSCFESWINAGEIAEEYLQENL